MCKKVLLVHLLGLIASVVSTANDTLEEEYIDLQNETFPGPREGLFLTLKSELGRFVIIDTLQEFFAAWRLCQSLGLRMASVNSADDSRQLRILLDRFGKFDRAWLAGTNLGSLTGWVWITTNRKITYSNWLPGEPNNVGGNERCLEVSGRYPEHWNDANCFDRLNTVICERNYDLC
ncbi:ladderlectin-like [Uranotaenia lowii]|uniref:ladderlectin-like n=1 Tax=Uranotaenia lowii TaxID=190385 RepID=UPI002479D856|nr:ladderlectin-like [Uranotaenia lowii]